MENIREEQLALLRDNREYMKRLAHAINDIIPELKGEEKEDTHDFLLQIVDGINYVIEIVNATMSLINEKDEILNKDGIEEKVQALSDAFSEKDNSKIAAELETGMLPFLDIIYRVSDVILSKEEA